MSTSVRITLPKHRIVYTGLDGRKARATAAVLRKADVDVTLQRQRVSGSRLTDLNPWHYTVIAWGNWHTTIRKVAGV